jgi:hypothetical protein
MVMALEQFSLPSRQQIVALAERFTNLEMRLDDLDVKLDRLIQLSSPAVQSSTAGDGKLGRAEAERSRKSAGRKQ